MGQEKGDDSQEKRRTPSQNVKCEPVELDEAVVLGLSRKVLETCNRVAEIMEPRGRLHDADQELIRRLCALLIVFYSVTLWSQTRYCLTVSWQTSSMWNRPFDARRTKN